MTELGEGVDGAVRRIERTFDVRGLPETITSFDSPTSGGVASQVKMEYNSFGQLISDYQEHAAVVSVGTSPKVGYRYDRLHRLVDFDRGKLIRDDDLIDPMVRKAQWTLDATGNWSRFRRFDQSDSAAALDQTRAHNGLNEVTVTSFKDATSEGLLSMCRWSITPLS